jgi:2-hydroxychromene-2-carboxylate isomerase
MRDKLAETATREAQMTLAVDLFFSFRSPYSYLAVPQLRQAMQEWDFDVQVRPVYPLAVRMPEFFEKARPEAIRYILMDAERVAEMNGFAYSWPTPDPVVQDLETLKIAKDQPYIRRLTRLGVLAAEKGHGFAFIDEVSALLFGSVEQWDQGSHLAKAAQRAGLDLYEMDDEIVADPDRFETRISENEAAQADAGHWGVPLMVFRGEPFFGQDRIPNLLWRMQQKGLKPRA